MVLFICWFRQSHYKFNQTKTSVHPGNEKNVCNSANLERKRGLTRCKKTMNAEILQTDKDDSSE